MLRARRPQRRQRPQRKHFVPALLAGLALVMAAGWSCHRPERELKSPTRRDLAGAARGWNLLLLSVDTVRADHLNAYGYDVRPTSPTIDELLGSGVRFAQAMAPRAATWPSLATVLTGLYPSGHGLIRNGYRFPPDLPTLQGALGAAGYRTAAFLSNMCQADHQGWDSFRCSGGEDGKTLARTLAWAAEAGDERPFFLWVHLFGAHGPYYNGGDLAATLDPGYGGPLGPRKWQLDRVMTEPLALSPRDLTHLRALYDAAITGTDQHVQRLLTGLSEAGRLERTVVVFLADHGEELYEHNGYLYHACSVYQSTLHVPLGIRADGLLPAGAVVAPPVELTDVAPTLLALLGVAPLPGIHGTSLLPYLARPDASGEGKPAFSEYEDTRIHTVLAGGWKLVDNPDDHQPQCFPGAPPDHYPLGRVELYHLKTDPGESVNLAVREPTRVAALREILQRRFAGLEHRQERQEIPPELREELEALGYVAQ